MQNTVQTDVIAPPRLGTGASARSKSMQNVLASTGTLASRRSSVSSKVHPNISTLVSLKEGQESKDGLARSGKIIGNGILTRKKSFSKTNINGNLSEKHPNMDRRKSITPVATPDNSEGNIRTNGSRRKTMGATHIVGSISNMNSSETCEGSDNATTISHRKRK